jgi:two-component system phosphate regulon sensor histidine kinase PhoR
LILRVRARLLLVAVALSLASAGLYALFASDLEGMNARSGVLGLMIVAFVVALLAGAAVYLVLRRDLRDVVAATKDVVRDTTRRVPIGDAPPGDEVRELSEWVNFLAEDATKSHHALARERALLAAVADTLNQGVIAVDADHRIELLNDAARKMLGVSSTPVGMPLIEFMRVPQAFELIDSVDAAQAEVQLPNGPRTLIRVGRKWEDDEGRVLLLEDVTAMRRLETMRRDFVANVSHELRTPIAVIRANAETLLAGAKDDPVMGVKLIDAVHRNSERLARLIADLLDLSRLDAGQYRMDIQPTSLKAISEQSLTAIEPQAAARNVEVKVEIPENLKVKADTKALDQIFVNLIDNAVKYSKPGGHVWIEARPDNDRVRIEIRDDGPGIPEKHRERVFERFYRADPSRAREAGGTGLGLSIVKHLVESMGGEVGVEPNTPNGSIFWLRLRSATK